MFPAANSAYLTGRLELTGRHREQLVPRLYLGWQHVLGLVGCWIQKTVKEWTVPQGVTRQVLEMMWRGDFVLAGPLSLNLKAMAATAWSLHLLPATPADPLPVKLKRRAGLLLVLQEVAGRDTGCAAKDSCRREGCWIEDDELPSTTKLCLLTRCGGEETKASKALADGRLDRCERRGGIYGKQGNNNKHLELTLEIQNTVNNIFLVTGMADTVSPQ